MLLQFGLNYTKQFTSCAVLALDNFIEVLPNKHLNIYLKPYKYFLIDIFLDDKFSVSWSRPGVNINHVELR